MTTETSTELTIPERATRALGLSNIEATLTELAARSVTIVAITNQAGYDQCHAARMTLKNQRVEIERRGKIARDDATKFSKAVIAEEKRLIDLIEPEEKRLQALQKAHDDAIEAERQAKIAAEAARVNEIQARITAIRNWPVQATGKPAALVEQMLHSATDYVVDESFAEFAEQAQRELVAAIGALDIVLSDRIAHEAEQARLVAERAELERLRAEQARRDAEAKAARDAEEKAAAEARAKEDVERAARIAQEDREIEARRAVVRAEIDQQEREAKAKREAEEKSRRDAEALMAPPAKPVMPAKPSDEELAAVISGHYAVAAAVADYWLRNYGRMTRAA